MGNKTRHTANLVSDNNLFVDIANDRVGIGSTQPTAKLNVAGIVSATSFIGDGSQLSGVTVTGNASLQQLTVSGNIIANGNIVGDNSTNITGISGVTAGSLTVSGNITANGNIVGDNATNISGVNQVTATTFSGSGASLTGLTGASAATYGGASVSPQITVDANGRITSISNVSIAGGGGGGGSSIIVQDSQSVVGAAGTIDFGTGLSVSAISAGVATVTSAGISTAIINAETLNVTGIATFHNGLNVPSTNAISIGGGGSQLTLASDGAGTTTDIRNTSGANGAVIRYRSENHSFMDSAATTTRMSISSGGQVQLNHSNIPVLTTIGAGVTIGIPNYPATLFTNQFSVSGISTFGSHVRIPYSYGSNTNNRLKFGNGDDLQIFHNNADSHIAHNGTGNLVIDSNSSIEFEKYGTSEKLARFVSDGTVELYHDSSKRFETTSTGVSISGNIDTVTDISCNSIANNAGGGATWTLNNTGNATFTGTVTANTFSGSGASLTNLPAANLTGTLPAISGANLTNLPAPTPADTDIQATFDISSNGSSAYRFTGPGNSGSDDNPDLYLVRGQRYRFINGTGSSHPFEIRVSNGGSAYTDGITGSTSGTQDFNVQHDAPAKLFYQCTIHSGMVGTIYIIGGDQVIPDNEKITFGNGDDLQIYHDGSNSVIKDNGTGKLILDTDGAAIEFQKQGLETIATFNSDGAVELYHDNSKKFETTSYGAQFTDNVKFDNPDTAGRDLTWEADNDALHWEDNTKATFGAGNDLEIYHNGSQNLILSASGQVLETRADTFQVTNSGGTENLLQANGDGAVNLYHDGTKRFETMSSGVKITNNLYLGGSTNGGFSYNPIADTLEFLTTNGGTHSELTHNAFVPSASGTRHLGYANKRWDTLYVDNIAFGGSANTNQHSLDDYEEGTFDPTIAPTSGSITLNSGFNTLSYTKIGRLVLISGQIRISSVNSPSGNTSITNLPFTAQSTTEQGRAGANCFYYDSSAGSGNYYKAVPIHVNEGTTTLKILNLHALGGLNPAANDELAFAFSYVAA